MEHSSQKISNKSLKYAKISLKKRRELVQLVLEQGNSIAKAAKQLTICLSTAKLIVKKYKEQGTFFEKKSDKMARLEVINDEGQTIYLDAQQNEEQNSERAQRVHQTLDPPIVTYIPNFYAFTMEHFDFQRLYWSLYAGSLNQLYLLH